MAYLTGRGEGDHTDPPEQLPAVFGLVGHQTFIGVAARIKPSHYVGAAELLEFSERSVAECQPREALQGQNVFVREMEKLPDVGAEYRKIKITAEMLIEPGELRFSKEPMVRAIGIIAGIPGQDRPDARSISAIPAGNIFLVEDPVRGVRDGRSDLEFIGKAQIEAFVNSLQELRIDKELLLGKWLFRGLCGMIAQAPELIGVITIGSLETADMIFPCEEDGGIERQDDLFVERVQAEQVDV